MGHFMISVPILYSDIVLDMSLFLSVLYNRVKKSFVDEEV